MPIGLHPDKTVKVYLGGDLADEPDKDKCSYFRCRFLTCAQTLEVGEKIARVADETDDAKASAMLDEVIRIGVIDWGNMGRDISPDDMFKLLTVNEKWELVSLMQTQTRLAELDRKNSGLARASAASAPSAPKPAAA